MKLLNYTKSMLALLALALLSASGQAATNYYHFSVSTASLIGAVPGAPFSLDFQLNGGGAFANTAIITGFNFGGGSASGSAVAFGFASGDIGSSVSLTADSTHFFNELYQAFTPGSLLQFDVSLTNNVNTPTPDLFSFAILDSNLMNISTTNPGDSLLFVEVSSPAPVPQTFSSPSYSVTAAVPEPATMLAGFALIGACGLARRRTA